MNDQFIRKVSLLALKQDEDTQENGDTVHNVGFKGALDLSEMRMQFGTSNVNEQGPSNCSIRVYNLSKDTQESLLRSNYTTIVLQAGYRDGNFGVIFKGDIKQFRTGRTSATDTFIDILAADGDSVYNLGIVNRTVGPGGTINDKLKVIEEEIKKFGATVKFPEAGGLATAIRGKVMYGLARTYFRQFAETLDYTWSIQEGVVTFSANKGYSAGTPVVLNAKTGLLGVPTQTQDGIHAQCLLNPKISVGQSVKIDNASIVQLVKGRTNAAGAAAGSNVQVPFDAYSGTQVLPNIARDGLYKAVVVEHEGDTRGNEWVTNLTLLAIDNSSGNVQP